MTIIMAVVLLVLWKNYRTIFPVLQLDVLLNFLSLEGAKILFGIEVLPPVLVG